MEEIRFTNTREDFWHYQLYILLRLHLLRVIALFLLIIGGFAYLSIFLGFPFSLLFLVCLLSLIIFRMWRNASNAIQTFKKRGVNSIMISEQGVRQKNEFGESITSWRAIKSIRADKHNLYFILEVAGSRAIIIALLIPRRAFVSQEEAASFLERARGYWREQSGQIATNIQ